MLEQDNNIKKNDFKIIINDNIFRKRSLSLSFSKKGFIITCIISSIIIIGSIFSLIAFTPIKTIIPGYIDRASRERIEKNAIKLDSLERIIFRWELYSENLRSVVTGDRDIQIDSIINLSNSDSAFYANKAKIHQQDSLLRARVQERDEKENSLRNIKKLPIESTLFFPPLNGVVSQNFNESNHPYIKINAPQNSLVMSILDGAVIFSEWSSQYGYTIVVQHNNDIISIYKHNQKLLKKIGDTIKAGTPIAMIGDNSNSTKVQLHFELWYKGESVNPIHYIKF